MQTLIDPATITAATKPADVYESRPCSRCGGSGRVGFAYAGGVCFGCDGAGRKLTARGAATARYLRALRETTLAGLRVGDRVLAQGFNAGSYREPTRWVTVDELADNREERATGAILKVERNADRIAEAREQGALITEPRASAFPDDDGALVVTVYQGVNVKCRTKGGERYSFSACSATSTFIVADPGTVVARLKSAAEYQLQLTKTGTVRKASRLAA